MLVEVAVVGGVLVMMSTCVVNINRLAKEASRDDAHIHVGQVAAGVEYSDTAIQKGIKDDYEMLHALLVDAYENGNLKLASQLEEELINLNDLYNQSK